ncbi:hypothetical protein PIB30_099106, partial [Stylosanthes scabra]|nr:hypothetical protein [Stylosanthes scabra]
RNGVDVQIWFPRICVGWHAYAWEGGVKWVRVPRICVGVDAYAWVVKRGIGEWKFWMVGGRVPRICIAGMHMRGLGELCVVWVAGGGESGKWIDEIGLRLPRICVGFGAYAWVIG